MGYFQVQMRDTAYAYTGVTTGWVCNLTLPLQLPPGTNEHFVGKKYTSGNNLFQFPMGSVETIIGGVWSYHTKMHAYLAVLLQWALDAVPNLVRGWFRFNNNYGLQQNNARVLATLGKEKMKPWAYLFIENGVI